MHQNCNSPAEIGRRLVFIAYILLYTTYLISCVVALARPGIPEIVAASSSLVALVGIRHVGYRWLDFRRLTDSFPSGCPLDRVPDKVREEVESLVAEFHASGTEWQRRVEIRHRLVELEEREPEIIETYAAELKQVLSA